MFQQLLLLCATILLSVIIVQCDPIDSSTPSLPTSPPAPTVPQITSFNIDEAVPTPSTPQFQQCINFLRGSEWTCYQAAEDTYGVKMERFLTDRQFNSPAECCALWYSDRCIQVKRSTYESCSDPKVLEYFDLVHQYYVEHCGSNWQNDTMAATCGAALRHTLNSSFLVLFFLFLPIGFCNFLFNVQF